MGLKQVLIMVDLANEIDGLTANQISLEKVFNRVIISDTLIGDMFPLIKGYSNKELDMYHSFIRRISDYILDEREYGGDDVETLVTISRTVEHIKNIVFEEERKRYRDSLD